MTAYVDARAEHDVWAAAQRLLFEGANLRVGEHGRVHRVEIVDGLPEPGCRQGYAGHGHRGELRPTRAAVTCRRCRRDGPDTVASHQGELF